MHFSYNVYLPLTFFFSDSNFYISWFFFLRILFLYVFFFFFFLCTKINLINSYDVECSHLVTVFHFKCWNLTCSSKWGYNYCRDSYYSISLGWIWYLYSNSQIQFSGFRVFWFVWKFHFLMHMTKINLLNMKRAKTQFRVRICLCL